MYHKVAEVQDIKKDIREILLENVRLLFAAVRCIRNKVKTAIQFCQETGN